MNPKRLIQVFNNHELGLQERLFRLLVTIGLMGLAMGILVGLVLGEVWQTPFHFLWYLRLRLR